jgi:hypothetical protein
LGPREGSVSVTRCRCPLAFEAPFHPGEAAVSVSPPRPRRIRLGLSCASDILVLALLLGCALPSPTSAATRRVPSEIPDIQAALDSSATGDTVLVEPGEYSWTSGPLTFRGKELVLRSEGGPESTILRATPGNGAIGFSDREDSSRVEGFTIRVGDVGGGSAISIWNAAPTIDNCVIVDNYSTGDCAGVMVSGGDPNWALALITNTVIAFNEGGSAGAIAAIGDAFVQLIGCTIHANTSESAPCSPFAAQVLAISSSGVVIERTIISGSPDGWPLSCEGSAVLLSCSNLYGNSCGDYEDCFASELGVNGNISAEPQYCEPSAEALDFSLAAGSPCLPGNHPDGAVCDLIGARGQGCAPTATTPVTWGRMKSLFR